MCNHNQCDKIVQDRIDKDRNMNMSIEIKKLTTSVFFNILIDFEILHSVDVEKGIISCGVQNARGVPSACHT
jgi:hypothetical protein